MLNINNLHANVGDKPILKGLTLSLNAGEIHANVGPNGVLCAMFQPERSM